MTNSLLLAIDLHASAHIAGDGQWVHLIPVGTFTGKDGRGPFRVEDADEVINDSRAMAGKRLIPIDYDHQIDFAPKNGRPAIAAGWIKGLQARANGIWGLVEWTPQALKHLAAKEYRYLSPVFLYRPDLTVTHLLRAALTNDPNLDQLKALCSMEKTMDPLLNALCKFLGLPETADAATALHSLEVMLGEWRKALELPPEADAASMLEAMTARANKAINAAGPDPARYVPIGEFERVVADLNKLNKGIQATDAAAHVKSRIEAGHLAPGLREWGVGLCMVNKPAFDAFVDRTKGAMGTLFRSISGALPPGGDPASLLSDHEKEICARMGISEADFAKAKPTVSL